MALSFGRRRGKDRHEDVDAAPDAPEAPASPPVAELSVPPANPAMIDELQGLARKRATGCLELVDRGHGGRARLFMYEGGLYAVELDGYRPDVVARLVAAGVLDAERGTDFGSDPRFSTS